MIWMLCALRDTRLAIINLVFLQVGHTYNKAGPTVISHLGGSAGKGLLYGRRVAVASPGDMAVHVVALEPLGPSVAMEGIDSG
jgi:hypothetical protein